MLAEAQIFQGDCAAIPLEDRSVDLCFTSPPYEDARLYGELNFKVKGEEWVEWAVSRFIECLRVTRGLCCWVVQGKTTDFRWSVTPALLMADLHRAGVKLRMPPIFHRVGIPGSGGPDWWRNDYEFIICATHGGRLPWSDNTATGGSCRFPPGGAMSYRHADGVRRNKRTGSRIRDGRVKLHTKRLSDGTMETQGYKPPERANPGNVIRCDVGGGRMGNDLAHETEAPFPESLAEPFVQCFCPPDGTVLDPMCGSGTTLAVALKHGRKAIGMDIRQSQVDLTRKRLVAYAPLFAGAS